MNESLRIQLADLQEAVTDLEPEGEEGFEGLMAVAVEPQRLSEALMTALLDGKQVLYYAKPYILIELCRSKRRFYDLQELAPLLTDVSVGTLLDDCISTARQWRGESDRKKQEAIHAAHSAVSDALHATDKNHLARAALSLKCEEGFARVGVSTLVLSAFDASHASCPMGGQP
jgi:hypothetical protein